MGILCYLLTNILKWLYTNKLVIKHPQVTTVERKTLILSLPYLGDISLETRTKLRKSFKGILNCCKPQTVFKSQKKLTSIFQFKDHLPFNLLCEVIYKCMCGRCNSCYYGKMDRQLKVRSGEHIGISHMTFRKVKPS